ncbi:MAG: hypothetical protein GY866_36335 [Proteobacteria bacterium]|nr:hypothetical protein [Pseudomonadota bacterium]
MVAAPDCFSGCFTGPPLAYRRMKALMREREAEDKAEIVFHDVLLQFFDLSLDAQPWKLFEGKVTRISALHKMKGVVRVYQVTVSFPNENLALRPGLQGSVQLIVGRATLLQSLIHWFQKTIRLDVPI